MMTGRASAAPHMNEYPTKRAVDGSRYWYPLSLPTYGVEEIAEAIDSMQSFRVSMGDKTAQFEREFARYQGCHDAIMVHSGSSADLLLALLLTNPLRPLVHAGDEVLVPVVTWPTQIWSLMMLGLKVRLVDVNPRTLNVDLDDLRSSITEKSRVLFLVHLMGNPCHMDHIQQIARERNLYVVEDSCESMGSTWAGVKVGNFGLGASFSFFFSHHITTMEGGIVAVNDAATAEQLRILRAHGWIRNVNARNFALDEYPEIDPRYAFVNWGVNVRPTEVQASFGIHQIRKAPAFAARRHELAERFRRFISEKTTDLAVPDVEAKATPSWLALPLMVRRTASFSRREITSHLEQAGVETRPIVAGNLARHPVSGLFPAFRDREFPGADEIHERGFYLGLSPMQTDENVDRLMNVIGEFLTGNR